MTGTLRVHGRPGGLLRFGGGLVVGAVSPGAPGLDTLLVRTGRVGESDWPGTRSAADATAAELVARGHVGLSELQVLRLMATQDALFAMVAGRMDRCTAQPGRDPVPGAGTGEEPERLLREADRRLAALIALPQAVLPDRERLAAVGDPGPGLAPDRALVLRLADGRRTARDIAFVAGRGVYAVTVEVSRMLAEGLLELSQHDTAAPSPQIKGPADPIRPRGPARDERRPLAAGPLPRRNPGSSGIAEVLVAAGPPANWREFLRLRGRPER
ncbi:MarR family transcriptional regulator [Streptomyces sp. NPDC051940]|uniref:MarR family transcriptional regulator n=1 Tax=Streptomyces sp. NPDC051940 TaxID=3155675 RepID=UPI00343251FD